MAPRRNPVCFRQPVEGRPDPARRNSGLDAEKKSPRSRRCRASRRQPCTWALGSRSARPESLFSAPPPPWLSAEQNSLCSRGRQTPLRAPFPAGGDSPTRHGTLKLGAACGSGGSRLGGRCDCFGGRGTVSRCWPVACMPSAADSTAARFWAESLPSPPMWIRCVPTTEDGPVLRPHHRTGGGPSGADPTALLPRG